MVVQWFGGAILHVVTAVMVLERQSAAVSGVSVDARATTELSAM